MKFAISSIILILTVISCASEHRNKTADSMPGNDSIHVIKSGCYVMIIDKDSALLDLQINGNIISGELEYRRFEKDDNIGTLTGDFKNNKITAWYKFESEGMISVKQVVFKVNNMTLSEGFGDVSVSGDTAYFKYPQTLDYEDQHRYIPVDCKLFK